MTYFLKTKLGYSYKKCDLIYTKTNISENIESRFNYANKIIPFIYSSFDIIFLDETGFNLGLQKLYGWEKIGIPLN